MKHYVSSEAVCPFYTQEQPLRIHCEGINAGSSIQVIFVNERFKTIHRKYYCSKHVNYEKCPLYEAINKQYQENKI